MRKIVIVGHFGGNEIFYDGQTIKTKILYQELAKKTNWDIKTIDTYYKSKKPVKLLFTILGLIFEKRDIIFLVSKNGMKFFFPIFFFFSKFLRKRVFQDVIGGDLDSFIKTNTKYIEYIKSYNVNWVETVGLRQRLEKLEVFNCQVIPNFKRLELVEVTNKEAIYNSPYKFCTFSRVVKEKGIEDAINAIEKINKEYGYTYCLLDIYGSVDSDYSDRFKKILENATPAIKYCGCVDYTKSVEYIKNYYALLFPTFWKSEGFPGTIVDSFSAGVPVIATSWNCNAEIISNKINGLIYPSDDFLDLCGAIKYLIRVKDIKSYKQSSINEAKKYSPEKWIDKIINTIEAE